MGTPTTSVCACVRACMRACVRACVHVCVCVDGRFNLWSIDEPTPHRCAAPPTVSAPD